MKEIEICFLNDRFSVDFEKGVLTWKELKHEENRPERITKAWNKRFKGESPQHVDSKGYIDVTLKGKHVRVHRIIFAMKHGYWPKLIDHIDGNKLNNSIYNLRDVSNSVNSLNRNVGKNNTSGVTGVKWHTQNKKWRSFIMFEGKDRSLGCYDNWFDAVCSRKSAEAKIYQSIRGDL